jgi:hypothetical protein
MSHTLVFASAESRLHADLVIVRLRKAGVPAAAISILYPRALQPNSAICWLEGSCEFRLSTGAAMSGAGFLAQVFCAREVGDPRQLAHALSSLGVNDDQSGRVEEILAENRIAVVVDLRSKDELPTILEVLQHCAADTVFVSDREKEAESLAAGFYQEALSSRTAA